MEFLRNNHYSLTLKEIRMCCPNLLGDNKRKYFRGYHTRFTLLSPSTVVVNHSQSPKYFFKQEIRIAQSIRNNVEINFGIGLINGTDKMTRRKYVH